MSNRVLIVDDSSFIREVLKTLCVRAGWEVQEAENGLIALEYLEQRTPDVVLMDLVMPFLNGLQTAEKMLRQKPDLPIIAISTLTDEGVLAEAISLGLVSYIEKPFDHETVLRAINEVFENNRRKCG